MKILLIAASLVSLSTTAFASTVSVATDPNAPVGNFGAPGNTATAGYTLTLSDDGSSVVGLIVQTGGTAVGQFANVYFDLNPSVNNGSDLGFEIGTGGVTAFIPGKNGQSGFNTVLDPSVYSVSGATPGTFGFTLANSLFTGPIAGLAYYGPADGQAAQTFESDVTLRLSQSLSFSVAGGASYGATRLGSVNVGGAVPEPASWALLLVGFGAVGIGMRRRARALASVAA